MQDKRSLFNLALTVIGSPPLVSDPEEKGKAQDILRLWYPVACRAVFTSFHWASLRGIRRLSRALTRNEGASFADSDPAPGYSYAYALPADMIQPQYLEDFSPFRLGRVGEEKLLFSNNPAPILSYTIDSDDPSIWEPDLYMCVIWSIAAGINTANNGKAPLTQKLEQQVLDLIDRAKVNAANEDDTYFDSPPSFWDGTGFTLPGLANRYYYPTASLRVGGLTS